MTLLDDIALDPFKHNFYAVLRELEREAKDKPRIGDGVTMADDIISLSQDPFTAFPSANVAGLSFSPNGTPRLSVRFLGMFGPQGALPLHLTETSQVWSNNRDPSFARFVDIVSTRFLQLFYRAWADARALAQFERPEADRFQVFLGSFAGIGTPKLRDADIEKQLSKLPFSGLVNSHVKGASRLEQLIRGLFNIDVQVWEWVGSWLELDVSERTALGQQSSKLGADTFVGKRIYSINEKVRIRIKCRDLAEYESFLPGAKRSRDLSDVIFYYVGYRQEFEIELGIERRLAPTTKLGASGKLGLTSWMTGKVAPTGTDYLFDARFDPMARSGGAVFGYSEQ
jgi:type VI secretion system protein ImpH